MMRNGRRAMLTGIRKYGGQKEALISNHSLDDYLSQIIDIVHFL